MALIRPRLNDHFDLAFTQDEVEFAIPYLDEDIPLYVDPFLLWKSPSMQDQALHAALISSFNHFGYLTATGKEQEALDGLICISECAEAGLGSARNKNGKRIGSRTAREILELFTTIPQIKSGGFDHIEEIQLFVDQISKDRISDLTCSLIKSFLIDFTMDQCDKWHIPRSDTSLQHVFDYPSKGFCSENLKLPINPESGAPILLIPKRWLRFSPWLNFDDYFESAYIKDGRTHTDRVAVLGFNRQNYDMVQTYVRQKELSQLDCKNDPLFKPIAVTSAKRKFEEIKKLPTGKDGNADKRYEDCVCQLVASMFYPQLDFASEQSRTDSGALIRDLIFYNNRSVDFLKDIYEGYGCRQIVVEIKNVRKVEGENINQLNRYLKEQFGRFGVIVTRNPIPNNIQKNIIDLWSAQRKCIIALTDVDLETMVTVFESKQRLPIDVLKRAYIEFTRRCPS